MSDYIDILLTALEDELFPSLGKDYFLSLQPVSYTHLDVYKRQHGDRRSAQRTFVAGGCRRAALLRVWRRRHRGGRPSQSALGRGL